MLALSFFTGGAVISFISGKSKALEAFTASFFSAALLGAAGSRISSDFFSASLIMIIPFALLSAAGAVWASKLKR